MNNAEATMDDLRPAEEVLEEQAEIGEDTVISEDKPMDESETDGKALTDEGPGKMFEFGDIHFNCSVCGNDNKVAEAVRGISFTVPAAEKADVRMECTKCGSVLKLYFTESSEEAKDKRRIEVAEEESKQQAAMEQMQAEMEQQLKENGISQEDTKEESGSGSNSESTGTADANAEKEGPALTSDEDGQDMDPKG